MSPMSSKRHWDWECYDCGKTYRVRDHNEVEPGGAEKAVQAYNRNQPFNHFFDQTPCKHCGSNNTEPLMPVHAKEPESTGAIEDQPHLRDPFFMAKFDLRHPDDEPPKPTKPGLRRIK